MPNSQNKNNSPSPTNSIDASLNPPIKDTTAQSQEDALHLAKLKQRYAPLNYSMDSLLEILEQSVIGQHDSLKKLLFLVYNNQYLNMLEDTVGIRIKHLNAIVIGPSGVGKTTAISKLAALFNVPFVKTNSTSFTSAGYSGGDVDSILLSLLNAAGGNIELAQHGIIYIDELDKKRASDPQNSSNRDINGTAVQEELLKLFEPSIVYLGKDNIPFDTHSLTIIGGGRFKGLEEIREKRLNGPKSIGFQTNFNNSHNSAKSSNSLSTTANSSNNKTTTSSYDSDFDDFLSQTSSTEYIPQDLIDYGFIEELIGRVLIFAEFKPLSFSDILDIIYSKDSILQQYLQVFASRDITLFIDPILFTNIAEEVSNSITGARDLESKLINLLLPALYETEQNYGPGICELDANGNFSCIFQSRKDNTISYKAL